MIKLGDLNSNFGLIIARYNTIYWPCFNAGLRREKLSTSIKPG